MFGRRTMAGFATDPGLGPGGVVTLVFEVVVLRHAGVVTNDATTIRVLEMAGPVKGMFRIDLLVGLQVIPALSALVGGATIPGHIQCLQMTATDIDQVLLQGIVAKGVLDGEGAGLAACTGGRHLEGFTLPVELRFDVMKLYPDIVEVTQHGVLVGRLHCLVVVRLLPVGIFLLMTLGTEAGAHKPDRWLCSDDRYAVGQTSNNQEQIKEFQACYPDNIQGEGLSAG